MFPKFAVSLFAVVLLHAMTVRAANYEPEALSRVLHRVEESITHGVKPVLVFDLDDTVIDTRHRTLRVLRDLAIEAALFTEYPEYTEALANLQYQQVHYEVSDTLKGVGIFEEAFIKKVSGLWGPKFFSDAYCRTDRPVKRAPNYVNQLRAAGGWIVYLTGRDIPRMEKGTVENLTKLGFPMGLGTRLMMKPEKSMTDLEFKKRAFQEIREMGTVVGGFENEPQNINAYQEAFPEGIMIFLDTIHSTPSVEPNEGIAWVKNFIR